MSEDEASATPAVKSIYAIWICPKEGTDVDDLLRKEMHTLAQRNQAKPFTPHVTLAKGLKFTEDEIISRAQELAKSVQKDILVTFKHLKAARGHLQTLVELNAAGHAALKEGARIFEQEYDSPLHLSICFWPTKPDVESRRREGQESYTRLLSPRGSLSTHPDNARGFPFATLQVWETPVSVSDDISLRTWRMIRSFDIPSKPQHFVSKIISGIAEATSATPSDAPASASAEPTAEETLSNLQTQDKPDKEEKRVSFDGFPLKDGVPKLPEDPVVVTALVATVCGVLFLALKAFR